MRILFLTFLMTLNLFAQIPQAEITNFNFAYNEPSGTASADTFDFDSYQFGNDVAFTVEKQAGSFYLNTPDETIEVANVPDAVLDLDKVELTNFSLNSGSANNSLSFDKLEGNNSQQKIKITNLSINCKYQSSGSPELINELLNSCLNEEGTIKVGSVYHKEGTKKATQMFNINFRFKGDNLNFRIKASGMNLKGYGKAYFENNTIRIKVNKAKVGPLGVKKKFFRELKKLESDKVKVQNPWIEISL